MRGIFAKMRPMFTTRTLLEGKWALLVLAALCVATFIWCPWRWAPAVPILLLAFTLSFFRDPARNISPNPRDIVSPADGKVTDVKTVRDPYFQKTDTVMVGIFLSVFDVHVQRSPIAGTIKLVQYNKGKFLDARKPECSTLNENRVVGIEGTDGFRVTVKQIAGLIAQRIVGWAGEGTKLEKGEHIGMIRFGSRVELFLPVGTEVTVKVGEHVQGGQVIARRN